MISKLVCVNNKDGNVDRVPNYAEFAPVDPPQKHFVKAMLKVKDPKLLTNAKLKLEYPSAENENAVDSPATTQPAQPRIRLWTKQSSETRNPNSINLSGNQSGDFVPPGLHGKDAVKKLFGESDTATLYVEGLTPSTQPADARLLATLYPDGNTDAGARKMEDAVRLTAVKADLDVDSDNNNALNAPERSGAEDSIEDAPADSGRPGKLVVVNDDDTDHDFIPDFADGFNADGTSGTAEEQKDDSVAGEGFTPLVIELPAPINLTTAKVKIIYSPADPANVVRTGTTPEYEYSAGSGLLRIWMKNGNQARNKASVKAATLGDFVPSDTFDAAQLGFAGSTRTRTFYMEGIDTSSSLASTRIQIEVDPDGSGPAGFMLVDAVRVTVIKIDLNVTWNSNECTEEVPGTPVLLNDDWDNQHKYGSSPPAGHFEKEPIWDKDYTDASVAAEDDLMKVTLAVTPADLSGNVVLKIPTGSGNVHIWPQATKGISGNMITIPAGGQNYTVASLPQDIYVEGIDLGRTEMTLDYAFGSATYTDKLNIDVVTLEESQGGTRKVINTYNSNVAFNVMPSTLSANYTYLWDLDGDGTRKNGASENGTIRTATVKYSADPSGAGNVQLAANAANRRKEYDLSVKLKGGELKGGLVVPKRIRVALNIHTGTDVAAPAGRQAEVAGLTTPPNGFTNTPPGDASVTFSQAWHEATYGITAVINDGNRLQYASTDNDANGRTVFGGFGADRRVYVSIICKGAYNAGLMKEDLQSDALHECRHASQQIDVKNGSNVWRELDDYFGSQFFNKSVSFFESDAYCVTLESNASWLHVFDKIDNFYNNYMDAKTNCAGINNPTTKANARELLQSIYDRLPFIEMKRSGYDFYVRAPE